jgi:hypothetical protein
MVKFITEKADELDIAPREFLLIIVPFLVYAQREIIDEGKTQIEFWDMLKELVESYPCVKS